MLMLLTGLLCSSRGGLRRIVLGMLLRGMLLWCKGLGWWWWSFCCCSVLWHMLMWLKGLLCSSRGGLRRIVLGMLLRGMLLWFGWWW